MSSSSTSIINPSLSEEQWVKHIRDALHHGIDIETPVSVHCVPESISSAKPEAYVPHHVALGPYHHLRPQLYQTEHPKLAAARRAQAALKLPAFDRTAGLLQAEEAKIRASYQLHLEVGTDTLKWIMTIDSLFLLDLLYRYKCSEYLSNDPFQEIVMIPTASKLRSVGIKLSLATGGIKTIAFDKKTATLKLPHIDLDATTEVLLRNLVAYEMISQRGSLILTRYTELMYGIIDTSEDLKLLREASIVLNRLNSDNKVVELFNGVFKSIGSKSTASELDETIRDVNEYYNSTRKVKAYNLMRKYVYSSWKFLTVVATVVLILLMVLETSCSILSCPRLFNTA
ncbi:hypothetical protein EUGRSUZ_L01981 [Eucalyptus grandis]|uniref:Uncharacterized protein n=1 Tax=Eucalyptus grandis TaxID=71139 RepID=A0A058ZRW3_EUCGR|nr:hypothetical protein EUGRSUZ_L01981 [Eucalyptus grandis]